jgi:pyruvate-ferredoxin/flavodoxin oxidoreductase
MDDFARLTGLQYHLYDYTGALDAERVIVLMGSGSETACSTAQALNAKGERTGVLTVRSPAVRLVRLAARCRAPCARGGARSNTAGVGRAAVSGRPHRAVRAEPLGTRGGGRYGLASKDHAAMAKAVSTS